MLLAVILQFPPVQTRVTQRIISEVSSRTGAELAIERISIRLPSGISIRGLFAEDASGDTLLYAGRLRVDMRPMAFLRHRVKVSRIALEDITANITRQKPDTVFNFDFILRSLAGDGAGNETQAPNQEKSASSWEFELGALELNQVRAHFADHFSGIDLKAELGLLSTVIDDFDPQSFLYHLGETRLLESRIELSLDQPSRPRREKDNEPDFMDLAFEILEMKQVEFSMETWEGMALATRVDTLEMLSRKLDISRQHIDLEQLMINGLLVEMVLPAPEDNAVPSEESMQDKGRFRWSETFSWRLAAGALEMHGAEIAMTTRGTVTPGKGFDPRNFHFSGLNLIVNELNVSPEAIQLQLENLMVRAGNGFRLNQLAAGISLGETLRLEQLRLETELSRLEGNIFAGFSPLVFPLEQINHAPVTLDDIEGRLASDLAWFFPPLREIFQPADRLLFGVSASGTLEELEVDTLWAYGPGIFRLETAGRVSSLLNPDSLQADVPALWLSARLDKLKRFVSPEKLPDQLALPDSISLLANFKGSMTEMEASADLQSGFGDLFLQGTFSNILSDFPAYKAEMEVKGFDPGKLLMQEDLLGPVFARLEAQGEGLDPETMDATASLLISEAMANAYAYKDLSIEATAADGQVNARLEYFDDNLGLEAENMLFLAGEKPSAEAHWDISHMNLRALNLRAEETILRADIRANLELINENFPEGTVAVNQLQVRTVEDLFSMDSLKVTTSYADSLYEVEIASPIVQGFFKGMLSPLEVPSMLSSYLGSMMGSQTDSLNPVLEKGSFEFVVKLLPSPWYSEFLLPKLSFVDPFQVEGQFDRDQGIINLEAGIPLIEYGDLVFNDFSLNADIRSGEGEFMLKIPMLEGEGFTIQDISAEATLRDQILDFSLELDDQEDELWLALDGQLWKEGRRMALSFDEEVLINREPWQFSPDNRIMFGDSLLLAEGFRLQKGNQYLLIQSRQFENGFPPLDIRFSRFDLGQFFALDSTPFAGGTFSGEITLHSLFEGFSFESDLNIENLAFRGDTLGNIHLLGSSPSEDLYEFELLVSGYGNAIEANGTYQSGAEAAFDLVMTLDEINLRTLEGLTGGQMSDLEGNMSGSISARGSLSQPVLEGSLRFQDAGFRVDLINAPYTIPTGEIQLDQETLRFQSFSLLDSLGRRANLEGTVNVTNLRNPEVRLNLTSQNFLLMNVPEGRNDLFWGRLFIGSDLRLRGDLNSPRLEGSLELNEGSSFSIIVPQSEPEAIGAEGVVEFFSPQDTLFLGMIDQSAPGTVISPLRNLIVGVNAEIDPKTDIKVIIDEYAGDYLEIKGGGVLSYGIDPGGRVSLAGRYEITEGTYLLTFYDLIRRRFQIRQGSSIVMTGDPMDSQVDITAIYNLRAPARDLFESAMTGTETDPALRQQFPFEVFLYMKGELLNPRISFAINLPESQRNALDGRLQSRLSALSRNESELNKQVFALLVLGQFVPHNPLASVGEADGGLSTAARNSASRILSQQLNRLSDQYIQGLDLNFEIESYEDFSGEETSGRTELQLEVSKNFLDERLRLQVGGNIELEDETRRQTTAGEIAGDFLLEYLLNPQGSLILRGFRKKEYGDLFEGEVVNTGISLLFTKSYNQFRELFMKKEKQPQVPDPGDEENVEDDEQ